MAKKLTDADEQPKLPTLLLDQRTGALLDEFGAGRASPGSGSAAALMGLLAAKLIQTVCAISKKKFPAKLRFFEFVEIQIGLIEPQLKSLFQDDAVLFDKVVEKRKQRDLATETAKKSKLSREANELLEEATEFSIDIGELCRDLLKFGIQVFKEGWGSVRGDSGAAISAATAGAMSAIFIANLNIKTLKNRNSALVAKSRCDSIYNDVQILQSDVFICMAMINDEATAALRSDLQLTFDL